jgi:hypothetical protein
MKRVRKAEGGQPPKPQQQGNLDEAEQRYKREQAAKAAAGTNDKQRERDTQDARDYLLRRAGPQIGRQKVGFKKGGVI